ncbi:MAG: recombinase family protein [Candidatus Sericytochromatia bacterium]|nr:recombinase family protein [Candidatus Sericytochromatia bacterium]
MKKENFAIDESSSSESEKIMAVGYVWTSPNIHDPEEIAKKAKDKIILYCKENNIVFKKMFKDLGTTGTANKRPEMIEMLKYIDKNKVNYLVLDSLYSVGRRFHDAIVILNEFNYKQASLISIDENIDTKSEEGQSLVKALFKIPQISQWLQPPDPKKKYRVQEILYAGGACPYGYMIDNKSNQYKIIEEEAQVVRRIFRERVSGRSLRQISSDLTRDEIATKRGGKWQANTIKTIIENPFYVGIYVQNNIIYKDCHDFIISEYLFNKINDIEDVSLIISKLPAEKPSKAEKVK